MKFLHIDAKQHEIREVEGAQPQDVYPWPRDYDVDHGVIKPGVGIIVWEYGLLQGDGPYFSLNKRLFAGDAILYGFDHHGETIDLNLDLSKLPLLWFLGSKDEVESAIKRGLVERPSASVNGQIYWEWNK